MKRLLCLVAAVLAACWSVSADTSSQKAVGTESEYQDIVYFAENRPLLIRLHVQSGRPLSAVWNAYISRVFRCLDGNGDGFLDKEEAQRLPPAGLLFAGNGGPDAVPAPAFRDLDANGDGKVTLDELATYFRRSGFGPFQVPGPSVWTHCMPVDSVDLNLLGHLTLWESGRNPDNRNEALFKLLDANGDGKLSRAELLAVPTILLKRDRNEDEIITSNEIVSSRLQGGEIFLENVEVEFFITPQRRGNTGLFRLVSANEPSPELARALQERYSRKDEKASDKGLTKERLSLADADFARLDVDGNGRLNLEELARFACRTPDLELKVDLGPKPAVELIERKTPLEARVRTGKDGALVLDLGGTRVDLKGLAAPRTETAQATKQLREQYIAQFKTADRDNNGYLDMKEAMQSPFFRSAFKFMDRDGDGQLFQKEMLAYLDSFLELQAEARVSCASVSITSEGKGLFEMLDADGDGRLSVRELRNAVKLLADLDRDGDGAISRTEIPRCFQAVFRLGPPPASFGGTSDVQSLVFSPDGQFLAAQAPTPRIPRGPEWFRKMDRNGDGDVSRREFLGTEAQFRAIDTDGDGLIGIEEAEAFEKNLSQQRNGK